MLKIITCLFAARSVPIIVARSLRPEIASGNSQPAHRRRLLHGPRTIDHAKNSPPPQLWLLTDTLRTRCLEAMLDLRIRAIRRHACCILQSRRPGSLLPSWDLSR